VTPRAIGKVAVLGGALVVGVAAMVGALRVYQQRHVTRLLDATLSAPSSTVPLSVTSIGETEVLVSSEALRARAGWTPAADAPRIRVEYLIAEFGGEGCGDAMVVRLAYTGTLHTLDDEFVRDIRVAPTSFGAPFRLLIPAFYESGPYFTHFDGVVVPRDRARCLSNVRRVDDPALVPLPFLYAQLAPSWRDQPLYQRFQADESGGWVQRLWERLWRDAPRTAERPT
jgi:hypothetical protein